MRGILLWTVIVLFGSRVHAQIDTWSWGAKVGIEASRLNVLSDIAPSRSGAFLVSPPFGLYLRTPTTKRYLFEFQLGYEVNGANKEFYYERTTNNWVRINDRFPTVEMNVIYYHHLLFGDKVWFGIGPKMQYIVQSFVKHGTSLPSGSTGTIYTPEVNNVFASLTGAFMYSLKYADVCLNSSFSFTPLINSEQIIVQNVSFSLMVKKRLLMGGRNGEF
jgi:hypothetical protein